MKKYILCVCVLIVLGCLGWYLYYGVGLYIDLRPDQAPTTFMKTDGDTISMQRDGAYAPFEIRGVDMGVGIPGELATDFAISEET